MEQMTSRMPRFVQSEGLSCSSRNQRPGPSAQGWPPRQRPTVATGHAAPKRVVRSTNEIRPRGRPFQGVRYRNCARASSLSLGVRRAQPASPALWRHWTPLRRARCSPRSREQDYVPARPSSGARSRVPRPRPHARGSYGRRFRGDPCGLRTVSETGGRHEGGAAGGQASGRAHADPAAISYRPWASASAEGARDRGGGFEVEPPRTSSSGAKRVQDAAGVRTSCVTGERGGRVERGDSPARRQLGRQERESAAPARRSETARSGHAPARVTSLAARGGRTSPCPTRDFRRDNDERACDPPSGRRRRRSGRGGARPSKSAASRFTARDRLLGPRRRQPPAGCAWRAAGTPPSPGQSDLPPRRKALASRFASPSRPPPQRVCEPL